MRYPMISVIYRIYACSGLEQTIKNESSFKCLCDISFK